MSSNVTFAFGSWIAVLGGIWFLFDKSENVASSDTKSRITRWLKDLQPPATIPTWLETFALVFDSVFTERHLSWKCLRRSALAAVCGLGLATLPGWTIWPREAAEFGKDLLLTGVTPWFGVVSLACVVNLLGTYISILKTRYVIHMMVAKHSASWLGGLLVLDAVTTLAIIWAGFALVLTTAGTLTRLLLLLTLVPGVQMRWRLLEFDFDFILSVPPAFSVLVSGPVSVSPFPLGVLFYAPLVTPVWAWLYVLSGSAVKVVHHLSGGLTTLVGLLDLDSKPITSLGWVAMLITSIVFWTVALVRYLRA